MKILIINGPNLNLTGIREPDKYGTESFEDYLAKLKLKYNYINFEYYQSNVEGELINKLQEAGFSYDGILLNAGAYTHTSIGLADAVASINTPVVEVHMTNIFGREGARHISHIGKHCAGVVAGFGLDSYRLALKSFILDQ